MRERRNHLGWALLAAVFVIIGVQALSAQAGIAVTPLKKELALRPGEQATVTMTLTYNSRHETDIADVASLSLADIDINEIGAVGFRDNATKPDSAGKWIKLGAKQVALQPGETQTVECTIAPPLSAKPGEYYSAILVTMANKGRTDHGVAVQFRIATGIFVTVLGHTLPKQAKITDCQFEWPVTPSVETAAATTQPTTQPAQASEAKLVVMMQNIGQARFEATGKMLVLDSQSRIVYSTPLQTSRACIFAGDTRRFEAPLTKALPPGKYTIKVNMDYQSTWSRARHELPLEILPEQSQQLAMGGKKGMVEIHRVEVTPARIDPVIPAGGTRSLALAVLNSGENTLRCSAAVNSDIPSAADSWITVGPEECTISKSGRKSLQLRIAVPPGTAAGKYTSNVMIQACPEGSDPTTYTVPLEIEVKSEKTHD